MPNTIPHCAIELLETFEGYARKTADGGCEAYPDPAKGWDLPTIGFGTTVYPDGTPVKRGDRRSREQAEAYLLAHLDTVCRPPLMHIPLWPQMNANQRGALYSFAYNLGAHFYQGAGFASITKLCDTPARWDDREWVIDQFIKYRSPGTAAERGLLRRRRGEAELFLTPIVGG